MTTPQKRSRLFFLASLLTLCAALASTPSLFAEDPPAKPAPTPAQKLVALLDRDRNPVMRAALRAQSGSEEPRETLTTLTDAKQKILSQLDRIQNIQGYVDGQINACPEAPKEGEAEVEHKDLPGLWALCRELGLKGFLQILRVQEQKLGIELDYLDVALPLARAKFDGWRAENDAQSKAAQEQLDRAHEAITTWNERATQPGEERISDGLGDAPGESGRRARLTWLEEAYAAAEREERSAVRKATEQAAKDLKDKAAPLGK